MKMKIAIIGVILSLGVFLSIPQKAQAEETLWATATIDTIFQKTDGDPTFRLTQIGNIFVNKLFKANGPNQKEILAIMLTAHSLNQNVRIAFYDGDPAHIIMAGIEKSTQ